MSLTDIAPSYKPPALPMQSQPAPQCSSTGTDSIVLFLPSTMSPITGQPYLCMTHMTQSPRGLLLTQQSLCLMSWNIQTWLIAHSKLIQFPLDDPRVCSGS